MACALHRPRPAQPAKFQTALEYASTQHPSWAKSNATTTLAKSSTRKLFGCVLAQTQRTMPRKLFRPLSMAMPSNIRRGDMLSTKCTFFELTPRLNGGDSFGEARMFARVKEYFASHWRMYRHGAMPRLYAYSRACAPLGPENQPSQRKEKAPKNGRF